MTGNPGNLQEAFKTTSPKAWYKGKGSEPWCNKQWDDIESELKHWKDKIILRILVTTGQNAQDESKLSAGEKTSKREYVIRSDESHNPELFGAAFDRLVAVMRDKQMKTTNEKNQIEVLDEERRGERKRKPMEPEEKPESEKSKTSERLATKARTAIGVLTGQRLQVSTRVVAREAQLPGRELIPTRHRRQGCKTTKRGEHSFRGINEE
jgi:hypothetical protein